MLCPFFRLAHRFAGQIAGLGLICLMLAGCGGSPKKISPVFWVTPAPITYGTALSAAQLNATASIPGTFVYSPSLGTVLPAGSQVLSVTFTPTDQTNYAIITAHVTLIVEQVQPALSWAAPAAISYGTALNATQLNATASVPGTFAYNPPMGAILSAGSHTLSVIFNPTDSTDYTTTSGSVQLTVNQATPPISWATPAAITYNTTLSATQLDATASVPGTFAYNPSLGATLSIGLHTLTVIFTPTDSTDYTSNSGSVQLTVNQATPQIIWIPTALIAVGAPLSSGQLDATATSSGVPVAGTFIYSPPAGTIFNSPGQQTLTVTFTPADTLDYTTPPKTSINMTASNFGIAAWGDSLTSGNKGSYDAGNYPSELALLLNVPVVNEGVSGNTSTQIGVREGGVPAVVSVDGGVIPATGGVTVTFPTCSASNCPTYTPVTPYGPTGGISGTIRGVHGTVTIDATGTVLTFTRTTPGSAVNAPGSPQFVVDTPYANYIPVFWEGRDDFDWPVQILSDLAGQVATVSPGQNYVILSILNENRPQEWYGVPGNGLYQWLIPFNEQLGAIYGPHYIDVRKLLVNAYDATQATDVSDYQHDEPPSSLRAVDQVGTLVNSIGPADTSITITTVTGDIPGAGSIVKIDTGANAENVLVTATSGKTMTVTRGFGGNQTSHTAGVPVEQPDIIHLNAKGCQIVANAVAQYLSAYSK